MKKAYLSYNLLKNKIMYYLVNINMIHDDFVFINWFNNKSQVLTPTNCLVKKKFN